MNLIKEGDIIDGWFLNFNTNMQNLLHNAEEVPKNKKLIIFDLDGTLAESKSDMDGEMALLMQKLLEKKLVAVIGGGKYELFQRQLISHLHVSSELLKNLYLFPTTGTSYYQYVNNDWVQIYKQEFTKEEKDKILSAFDKVFAELNYKHPDKIYGQLIEDRGGEITFSVFGQEAPIEIKEKWNKENPDVRSKMESILQNNLPDMEVKVAGLTSIDVTRRGIDKGYGVKQIREYLDIPFEDMLFVGDAFFYEGNDEAVLGTGILCLEVKTIEDTKKLIRHLL
ncbi:MAG: HAD-IIB family hydrolase [bacterium]|nr:HAD-IIB family hydrolase [bacterium]